MVWALSVILTALALGLLYVWLRRFETVRGGRFFEASRARFDARASALLEALVLGGIPVSWRKYVVALFHEVVHTMVRFAVDVIRAVERPLARLSYRLRVSAPKGSGVPVSEFLRTISPEKK